MPGHLPSTRLGSHVSRNVVSDEVDVVRAAYVFYQSLRIERHTTRPAVIRDSPRLTRQRKYRATAKESTRDIKQIRDTWAQR